MPLTIGDYYGRWIFVGISFNTSYAYTNIRLYLTYLETHITHIRFGIFLEITFRWIINP